MSFVICPNCGEEFWDDDLHNCRTLRAATIAHRYFIDTLCDKDCKPLIKRNSGKTFRKILKALGYASEGKKVYYIYDHHHEAAYLTRMMEDCVHTLRDVRVCLSNRRLEFATGGSIQLVELERFKKDKDHLLCSADKIKVIEDLD